MPTFSIHEGTAATWTIGQDIMTGNRFQREPRYRQVLKLGVTGSAATSASIIQLFYGNTFVGDFAVTTSGVAMPLDSKDIMPVNSTLVLMPGEDIHLYLSGAQSGTNPLNVTVVMS